MKKQPSSHHLLAEHLTNAILKALESIPGNSYIGKTPVKHKIIKPVVREVAKAQCRKAIEKKFNKKWNQ